MKIVKAYFLLFNLTDKQPVFKICYSLPTNCTSTHTQGHHLLCRKGKTLLNVLKSEMYYGQKCTEMRDIKLWTNHGEHIRNYRNFWDVDHRFLQSENKTSTNSLYHNMTTKEPS